MTIAEDSNLMSFRCQICNELHEGLPDIGAEFPDPYFDVTEDEREQRVFATTDLCSIDDTDFFIRGVIEIPVHGAEHPFGFGVWVSQKKENFQTYVDNFDSASIGPFFGWLTTGLTCYTDDTYGLKTMVHFRSGGLRPLIEIEPSDHPLSVDQENGISLERAWKLVHHYF